jgi:rhamnosyltransferase
MMDGEPARILVLLAAFNGSTFISEQLTSILGQHDVDVEVLVSVDVSSDGTEAMVTELAASEPRLRHLPHGHRFGGAAPNFYRLMTEADLFGFTHVALADQDDVWFPEKLARATEQLRLQSASCYSSNVISWFDNGRSRLLDKAQPQRTWDYLFSSAGPGCTYVITSEAMADFAHWLREDQDRVAAVAYHDWLLYAWMRANNRTWYIDPRPTMRYRQHAANQLGVNVGLKAAIRRAMDVKKNWFTDQVRAVAECVGAQNEPPIQLLHQSGAFPIMKLALMSMQLRRSRRDALAMAVMLFAKAMTGGAR